MTTCPLGLAFEHVQNRRRLAVGDAVKERLDFGARLGRLVNGTRVLYRINTQGPINAPNHALGQQPLRFPWFEGAVSSTWQSLR